MKTLKIKWDLDSHEYTLYDNEVYVGMLCKNAAPFVGHLDSIKIAAKNPKKKGWFKVYCVPTVKTVMRGKTLEFIGCTLRCYLQKFCGVEVNTVQKYSFYAKFD